MFIGHYAVALAAKKAAPKTSFGTLFIAAQFIDLLWPLLLLLGLEHVRIDPGNTAFTPLDFYDYPITHSLLAVIGWSFAFGVIYFALHRDAKASWVLGIAVLSHWVLDFLTHRPDLPIAPGLQIYAGLGLWNSLAGTLIVEGAMFVGGIILYARTTVATDRTGRYAFWSLIAFISIGYITNFMSRQQPPSSVNAIAIGGLTQWLVVAWAYWIDRHRKIPA